MRVYRLAGFSCLLQKSIARSCARARPPSRSGYRLRYQVLLVENATKTRVTRRRAGDGHLDDRSVHALLIHRLTMLPYRARALAGKDRSRRCRSSRGDCISVSGCGGCRIHVPAEISFAVLRRNSRHQLRPNQKGS